MAVGLLAATWGGSSGPIHPHGPQSSWPANYDSKLRHVRRRNLLSSVAGLRGPPIKRHTAKIAAARGHESGPSGSAPTEPHVPHTFERRIRRGVPTTGAMNVALPMVALPSC